MLILDVLFNGLHMGDVALLLNRVAVGAFFAISGYHKLFNAKRHASFVETLKECGVPCIAFNQWFVPIVEFLGGLAVTTGFLAPLAALGMFFIMVVAICTDGITRILPGFQPIDAADYLDDVLYLPETSFAVMLLVVMLMGPGHYSLHVLAMHILGL